jgi:hypothetical protein
METGGAERTLFISEQPASGVAGELVADFADQSEQAMNNVENLAVLGGMRRRQWVRTSPRGYSARYRRAGVDRGQVDRCRIK